jgi:hypothetical protein
VKLQSVDEFDTRAERYECSIIRVAFDPVELNYYVGYDWGHVRDNVFKDWTQVDYSTIDLGRTRPPRSTARCARR